MKRSILLALIFILIAGAGYFGWEKLGFGTTTDQNIYKNEKYGFQIILPKSWIRYEVREEAYPDSSRKLLRFGLPLEQELNGSRTYDRWFITITPIKEWVADVCKDTTELCTQGEELGRNEAYVFETEAVSPTMGSDCQNSEFAKTAIYACSVYRDIGSFYNKGFELIR